MSDMWDEFKAADPALNAAALDADAAWERVDLSVPATKRTWFLPTVAASVALLIGSGATYSLTTKYVAQHEPVISSGTGAMVDSGVPVTTDACSTQDCPNQLAGTGNTAAGGTYLGARADSSTASGKWRGGQVWLEPADSLSTDDGSAASYTVTKSTVKPKAFASLLQKAFDLPDKISGDKTSGYLVGVSYAHNDGTHPNAFIWSDGTTTTWNYDNPDLSPYNCKTPDKYGHCPEPDGPEVTAEEAMTTAQQKFAALGLNTTDLHIYTAPVDTHSYYNEKGDYVAVDAPVHFITVQAIRVIDGLETPSSWSMMVGPKGVVVNAQGSLMDFEKGATYDIVSPHDATLRSQSTRWNYFGPAFNFLKHPDSGGYPIAYAQAKGGDLAISGTLTNPDATASSTAKQSGPAHLQRSIDEVRIDTAAPALVEQWLPNGTSAYLPAYELSNSGNPDRSWLQLAIADKYFD